MFYRRTPTPKTKDVCVIFDVYRTDWFSLASYRSLQIKLANVCDIFFVLHGLFAVQQAYPSNTLILDDSRIFDKFPNAKSSSRRVVPGNCDLKTLAAIEELDIYDRYISMEFDVICIDDVENTFLRLIKATEDVDFACSYLEGKGQQPAWMWWSSLSAPDEFGLDESYIRRSFLPLSVYSRGFMTIYRAALDAGWRGHQEVLLPTIAFMNDLRIAVLNQKSLNFTAWPPFNAGQPDGLEKTSLPSFLHSIKSIDHLRALPLHIQQSTHLADFVL